MNSKIKLTIKCLYANFAIQAAATAYSAFSLFMLSREASAFGYYEALPSFTMLPSLMYLAVIGFASRYAIEQFKADEQYVWPAAVAVMGVSVVGWGVIPSVVGILALWDREVRTEALKKLELV